MGDEPRSARGDDGRETVGVAQLGAVPGLRDLLRSGGDSPSPSPSPFVEVVAGRLEAQQAAIAEEILGAIRREIPEYGAVDDRDRVAELRASCQQMIAVFTRVLRSQPGLTPDESELVRQIGRRRAEQGFPLSAVVSAFGVGMNVGWEYVARQVPIPLLSPEDANRVLSIALQLLHFIGEASRTIAEGYLDATVRSAPARELTSHRFVDDFLSGAFQSVEDLGSRAARFAHELRRPHAIVLIAARPTDEPTIDGDGDGPLEGPWTDAGDELTQRVADALPLAVLAAPVPHAAALVPASSSTTWPELLAVCEEVRVRHGVTVLAVPPVAGTVAIYESYTDARDSLALARKVLRGHERVTSPDDLRIYRVLSGRQQDRRRYLLSTLGPVLELKESRRRPLLDSLEAWYAAEGSVDEAARTLFVHPNTMRYRLRRVEDLTGLSLRTPAHQVRLDIALHLLRLEDDSPASV